MAAPALYELIGYLASALVVLSLLATSLLRLRVVNALGAATFTAYGALIGSPPVALTNAIIVAINGWFLWRVTRVAESFDALRVAPEARYLAYFLRFHAPDIARTHGAVPPAPGPDTLALFVLRDAVPAGLLLGHRDGRGALDITLDYATPAYRDLRIGRFLFHERRDLLRAEGIDLLRTAPPATPSHARYLRRMGFAPTSPAGAWTLALS